MDHEYYMKEAYEEALKAYEIGEVPIGCVIVHEGAILARGYNQRNSKKNVLWHAEIIAINEACAIIGDWRLEGCTLFVTVEPCPMCAGAIVQARISEVIFGTKNRKAGCAGSILNLFDQPGFNHRVSYTEGILQEACTELMSGFFKRFRIKQ